MCTTALQKLLILWLLHYFVPGSVRSLDLNIIKVANYFKLSKQDFLFFKVLRKTNFKF